VRKLLKEVIKRKLLIEKQSEVIIIRISSLKAVEEEQLSESS
jgi:hypothetical protein